jgi:hypothetical protein
LNKNYFTAIPNQGAGIGHQMANWIAGYWFARQFDLNFSHTPFSNEKWEIFLGLGENEITISTLVKCNYKKIYLPLFDEFNLKEVELIKKIISSYDEKKIVFIAEQDQFYHDQFGVMTDLNKKFHGSTVRKKEKLIYSKENFNIAIHVRRGDIVIGQDNKNPNLVMRWQNNDYFEKVLASIISDIRTEKPVYIYLFSQGVKKDFQEFEKFNNFVFCLDMNPQETFLHMVQADLLITSKSSFSYKPALLSNGIKVCPREFWHGYPDNYNWILVDEDGNLDKNTIKNISII